MGFYNCTNALSAALGQAWVGLSADPLLIWNYASVAIIVFCAGIAFWILFTRPWDKEEEHMNMLKESKYRGNTLGGDEEKRLDEDDSVHRAESVGLGRGGAEHAPLPREIKE